MLVTRYLMKNLLSATLFVALTLTAVIWLTQSLKLPELVANSDAPPLLFIKLVTSSLPSFLETILPISLVTVLLFVYNKSIMDNELIVLRSCAELIALTVVPIIAGFRALHLKGERTLMEIIRDWNTRLNKRREGAWA